MDLSIKISLCALAVSIITGIFGAFGGIPGINALFFSKPKIIIDGFMPAVVYDDFNDKNTVFPKFSLKGAIKISNPNSFDLILNEAKLYGRTKESSGELKHIGKAIFYELNLSGTFEEGYRIINSHSSVILKCNFAHFENDQRIGAMYPPMAGGNTEDLKGLLFQIFVPSFNQLFIYNAKRTPSGLVPEAYDGRLSFAIVFNNELIKIIPHKICRLTSFSKADWQDNQNITAIYNGQMKLTRR